MEVVEIRKKIKHTKPKHEVEELVKKKKKEYYRMTKGRFEFVDAQGGWLDFTDRQFPGEPIVQYKIHHGEICEIPAGLAKRLNGEKKKVRGYGHDLDHRTGRVPPVVERISRINFIPMEVLYTDEETE